MTALGRVTELTRKILAGIVGSIVALVLILGLIKAFGAIKEKLYPTPIAPPTVTFGKIPDITFPKNTSTLQFSYSINTLTGFLPTFSDRVTIYKLQQPTPNLLSYTKYQNMLNNLGFTTKPNQISDVTYSWQSNTPINKTITVNTLNSDFTYTTTYLSDSSYFADSNIPNKQTATQGALDFLTSLNLLPKDLDSTKTLSSLYTISSTGQLTPATNIASAQYAIVDFFQNDINKMHIFYPNAPHNNSMQVSLGALTGQLMVTDAKFMHRNILSDFSATYPIISSQEAFNDLKTGKAYIAGYDGSDNNISIKDVQLGYFLGDPNQQYLMPVIVFIADNNFFAYVSAISPQWIGNAPAAQ
jgi:hypothetical protein